MSDQNKEGTRIEKTVTRIELDPSEALNKPIAVYTGQNVQIIIRLPLEKPSQ
jgi:hypothetical protein